MARVSRSRLEIIDILVILRYEIRFFYWIDIFCFTVKIHLDSYLIFIFLNSKNLWIKNVYFIFEMLLFLFFFLFVKS